MPENPIHLVVGTPCYGGQVTSAYFSSILKLQEECQHRGLALTFLMPDGADLVQKARQEILVSFLAIPDATHLLFIDSDIGFEPDQVFRLLAFNADFTAGAYPLKHIYWDKTRVAVQEGRENLEPASLHYVVEALLPPVMRGGFLRALSVGTGFLLAKRRVFIQMTERYPDLRYPRGEGNPPGWAFFNCGIDPKSGDYLGEDYSFCRLWTAMGGEIWADMESKLNHVGQTVFTGDFTALFPPAPKTGGGA